MADEPLSETTIDDQRRRSVERLLRQQANGRAPQAQRSNAPAPPAEINWAPVIGQVAADCQREIAALREQVKQLTELAAKPTEVVATGLSEKVVASLFKVLAPAIKSGVAAQIREATTPLTARLNEIENVVRTLAQTAAASKRSVATIPHSDAGSGRFVNAVGGTVSLAP